MNSFSNFCWFVCWLGLRHGQADPPPWGAAVYSGWKSLQWHSSCQTAVSGVCEPLESLMGGGKALILLKRRIIINSGLFQTQDLQIVCYAFTAFGKSAIKQKKLHPDTFIQLAMQLAYQRLHKKYASDTLTIIHCISNWNQLDSECVLVFSPDQESAMRRQRRAGFTTPGQRLCGPAHRRLWAGARPWWTLRVM